MITYRASGCLLLLRRKFFGRAWTVLLELEPAASSRIFSLSSHSLALRLLDSTQLQSTQMSFYTELDLLERKLSSLTLREEKLSALEAFYGGTHDMTKGPITSVVASSTINTTDPEEEALREQGRRLGKRFRDEREEDPGFHSAANALLMLLRPPRDSDRSSVADSSTLPAPTWTPRRSFLPQVG